MPSELVDWISQLGAAIGVIVVMLVVRGRLLAGSYFNQDDFYMTGRAYRQSVRTASMVLFIIAVTAERTIDYSIEDLQPYFVLNGGVLSVTQMIGLDWYVVGRVGRAPVRDDWLARAVRGPRAVHAGGRGGRPAPVPGRHGPGAPRAGLVQWPSGPGGAAGANTRRIGRQRRGRAGWRRRPA